MKKLVQSLINRNDKYFAVLPNAGYPQVVSGRMVFADNNAGYFAQIMHDLAESGADIIGGCCGTTPEYISQMVLKTADVVHMKINNVIIIAVLLHLLCDVFSVSAFNNLLCFGVGNNIECGESSALCLFHIGLGIEFPLVAGNFDIGILFFKCGDTFCHRFILSRFFIRVWPVADSNLNHFLGLMMFLPLTCRDYAPKQNQSA